MKTALSFSYLHLMMAKFYSRSLSAPIKFSSAFFSFIYLAFSSFGRDERTRRVDTWNLRGESRIPSVRRLNYVNPPVWNNAVTAATTGRNDLHIAKICMLQRCKLYDRASSDDVTSRSSRRAAFCTAKGGTAQSRNRGDREQRKNRMVECTEERQESLK